MKYNKDIIYLIKKNTIESLKQAKVLLEAEIIFRTKRIEN